MYNTTSPQGRKCHFQLTGNEPTDFQFLSLSKVVCVVQGPPILKPPMNTFVCIIKLFSLTGGLPSTPSFPAVEEGVLEDTAENTALANGNSY